MSYSEAVTLDLSKLNRSANGSPAPVQKISAPSATELFYCKSEEQDSEELTWHATDDGEKLGYFRTKEEVRAAVSKFAKIQFVSGDSHTVEGHEVTRWKICSLQTLSPGKYLRR